MVQVYWETGRQGMMGRGAEPQDDNCHTPTERTRNLGRAGRCKARFRTRAGWTWPVPRDLVSSSHRGPHECSPAPPHDRPVLRHSPPVSTDRLAQWSPSREHETERNIFPSFLPGTCEEWVCVKS